MSIYKTEKGWVADIIDGFGKRLRPCFPYKSEAEAFITKIKSQRQGMKYLGLKPDKGHELVEALADTYYKEHCLVHQRRPEQSELSRIRHIQEFFKGRTLGSITREDADKYIVWRHQKGLAVGTINRELNTVKSFFGWLEDREYIQIDPFRKVSKLAGATVRCRWLNKEEMDKAVWAFRKLQDHDMVDVFHIGTNNGFRKENLQLLEAQHVTTDFASALKTKSNKPYDVPHTEFVKPIYARLIAARPTGPILNTRNFDERFKAGAQLAGLYPSNEEIRVTPAKAKDPNRVTIHVLRHTFASHMLQAGVPIYTVSKWLGHSSVRMTEQVYGHLCPSHHTDEIKKVPGVGIISLAVVGQVTPISVDASLTDQKAVV